MKNHKLSKLLRVCLAFALSLVFVGNLQAQDIERRTEPWSKEVIELFATLPVQDGGRVKPLDSFAGLHLLTLNAKRTLEVSEDVKLKPSEWLLDCFFFPEQAKEYPNFYIRNDAVLTAIGIDTQSAHKKKTDRYSYNELAPGRRKLQQEAARIAEIPQADQTPLQAQTVKLAHDLFKFDSLIGFLEPLRWRYSTGGTKELLALFGAETSSLSAIVENAPALGVMLSGSTDEEREALEQLLRQIDSALQVGGDGMTFMPAAQGDPEPLTWWKTSDVVLKSFTGQLEVPEHIAAIQGFERLEELKTQPAAFEAELTSLHTHLVGMAGAEYGHVPLEVKLYRWDPFTNSLVFYLLAFLFAFAGFLAPKSKWIGRGLWASISTGLALAVFGIVLRCIIRGRPPVVSLYDTILFITSVVVIVSLVAERLTRQRVAISVASVLGIAGMFLAMRYELKEVQSSGDTMASVVAVLDTNYYLAIHVTTITMGYAGGLLAGAIAHVWILGKLFRFKKHDPKFYKTVTRMAYGVLCFSLLCSIFGTIMGGVWANDSWGRFWGWDPKENGALLICIWELLILHARMGGYIKDRGFAVMLVLGAVVVSASWWGVNLLSIGLHSYGFTNGVFMALVTMWAVEAGVVGLSGVDALLRRLKGTPA